jgi:VWFA-related protein
MRLRFVAAALLAVAVQSQPPIRTRVDLIRLDVTVVDNAGLPVRDLAAADFTVKVDGAARAVSFAKFHGPDDAGVKPGAADVTTHMAGLAINTNAPQGRAVVIVVDLESMRAGHEKLFLDTTAKLVDRLGPADSVGLLVVPGKSVDLTREHGRVRDALQRLRGFAADTFRRYGISAREAEAFRDQDTRVIAEVIARECRPSDASCPAELTREARLVLSETQRRMLTLMTTLADLTTRLQRIEGPRTILLLSAGLAVLRDSTGYFRDLQRRTAEAGTAMHVVQFEQPDIEASRRRGSSTGVMSRSEAAEGLSAIAGYTGGTFFNGVGTAAGVFDRIHTQIAYSYQLGVESLPRDADGKTHSIDVQVGRPGLTVRSRSELIVAGTPRPALTPGDVLTNPTDLAEVPVAVAAYSTRGDEASTLKVVVLVETRGAATPQPTYGFTVTKDDRTVFETADPMTTDASGARAVVAAQLAPGRYRLRAAVVDAAGRPGSVEMPLVVALRQAGPFQFSDLVVGTASGPFSPAVHVASGSSIGAVVEIYTEDPAQFEGVGVDLEVQRSGDSTAVERAPATVSQTASDRRRVASGHVALEDVAPGAYVVSAIVRRGSVPLTKVSRPIVITAPNR